VLPASICRSLAPSMPISEIVDIGLVRDLLTRDLMRRVA
jgi:hypothetical protein